MQAAVDGARYRGCQSLLGSAAAGAAAHVVEELGEQGRHEFEALGRDAACLEPVSEKDATRLLGQEERGPSLEYFRPLPEPSLECSRPVVSIGPRGNGSPH